MDALLKEKAKVVGNKHFRTPEKAAVEVTEKPTPSKQPAKKGRGRLVRVLITAGADIQTRDEIWP